jgi:hypothetical protein
VIKTLFRDARGDYPGPDAVRHPLLSAVDYDGVLRLEMLWATAVVAYGTNARDVAQVEALRDALTIWLDGRARA